MRVLIIVIFCLVCFEIPAITIFDAIRSKDNISLKQIISGNPGLIDSLDSNGDSPLLLALRDSIPDIAILLMDYKPRLDIRNNNGALPIHLAAQKHSVQLVQRLISLGADVNSTDT